MVAALRSLHSKKQKKQHTCYCLGKISVFEERKKSREILVEVEREEGLHAPETVDNWCRRLGASAVIRVATD